MTYESIFYRKMKKPRRTGGQQDLRVPDAEGELVQLRPQDCSTPQITGFANRFRQYCTGELKQYTLSHLHFLIAPYRRGLIQILWCSI